MPSKSLISGDLHNLAGAATSPESPPPPPPPPPPPRNPIRWSPPTSDDDDDARGVKEDISELTKTLTRQFWGVANFLAPPPHSDRRPDPRPQGEGLEATDGPGIPGIRGDFAEIGGRFKSRIAELSGHRAVSGISKIASNFLPFRTEDEEYEDWEECDVRGVESMTAARVGDGGGGLDEDVVGVTKEVKTFIQNISMHPETWLDFPLWSDDEDVDDFELSDAQQEHAMAVERFSPRLAALRIELCPVHMSEGCFWKTYFVLLHPRLEKHDAELLSTPQIVEARELLSKKLQERAKLEMEKFAPDSSSYRRINDTTLVHSLEHATATKDYYESSPSSLPLETEVGALNYPSQTTEFDVIDKAVTEEEPLKHMDKSSSAVSNISINNFDNDDEDDDWLNEEEVNPSGSITIPLDNEDVSFSDLEDEDVDITPKASKC